MKYVQTAEEREQIDRVRRAEKVKEKSCPLCGDAMVFVGYHGVECTTQGCVNYSQKQVDATREVKTHLEEEWFTAYEGILLGSAVRSGNLPFSCEHGGERGQLERNFGPMSDIEMHIFRDVFRVTVKANAGSVALQNACTALVAYKDKGEILYQNPDWILPGSFFSARLDADVVPHSNFFRTEPITDRQFLAAFCSMPAIYDENWRVFCDTYRTQVSLQNGNAFEVALVAAGL